MAETGNWSDYIIGEAGRNLRQHCIAEGKKPVFTKAVIGTGKPSDSSTIEVMSNVVAYAKNVIIKKSYSIEANHLCIVRVDNTGYTQDIMMTEIGIFAKAEDQDDSEAILYGYAYNLNGYILIPAQTSVTNRKIFEITLDTNLSRSVEISIIFDGSSLWVSHADMDDLEASMNASLLNKVNMPILLGDTFDLNNVITSGFYKGNNTIGMSNYPIQCSQFSLLIESTNAYGKGIKQTFTSYITGSQEVNIYIRLSDTNANGDWTPWIKVAMAEPPVIFPLSMVNNIEQLSGECIYYKTSSNLVTVNFDVKTKNGAIIVGEYISILPEGYRPAGVIKGTAVTSAIGGADFAPGSCYVNELGQLYLTFSPTANAQGGSGSVSFVAL